MLTGISSREEVLGFFAKWLDKEYPIIDDDDQLFTRLVLASADDLIQDDVDYWANQSVKVLFEQSKNKLMEALPWQQKNLAGLSFIGDPHY